MNVTVTSNKQGQSLGPKGRATRNRILAATRKLLKKHSPLELTVVSIAQVAGTSSATVYMYFDDVRDILFELASIATYDVIKAFETLPPLSEGDDVESKATELIRMFQKVWNTHRNVLRYRNLEADRGDSRFDNLRMDAYLKELELFADWMRSWGGHNTELTKADALSLASVLHSALERMGSIDPKIIEKGMGVERIIAAEARIVAQVVVDSPEWGNLPIDV